ncbi:MAG: DNA-binding protein [Chloroflexi bacterium]|nr:DNA-binding protein [Chloroflexota bacterium]MBM3173209.1 DNA-binding protein [Chloroflexota bacterium]MBM3175726.1 DNA-binding protein [Chloroflexota bacterium]
MKENTTKKQVPTKEGMLKLPTSPKEQPSLLGSRCRSCGETYFIIRNRCEQCQSEDLEHIELSRRGKLHSYSIMYYPAPPPYKPPDPFVPYGLGWIELPEGLAVLSHLTENNPEKLRVGMEMELIVEKLEEDEMGNEVMYYKFRPVK